MYGDLAEKLVQEARRSQNLDKLPLYNNGVVRGVSREVRELTQRLEVLGEELEVKTSQDQQLMCTYFVLQLAARRNKRCMMAYHHQRACSLEQVVWADVDLDTNSMANLSPAEQEYLREYADLVVDYKGEWSDVDLTASLEPPREMYVEVRVLKDAGEIQTEYGVFNLTKDSQFFVRQADVQRLIQQGLVQLV